MSDFNDLARTRSILSEDESPWRTLRDTWGLRPDTIYLNHGSFGTPPAPVRRARAAWLRQMDSQPMDFFVRAFEPAFQAAREDLGRLVGSAASNLICVENATYAMNILARSVSLSWGDEVLLTDH